MEKSIKALFIELERVAADLESLNNPAVIKEKTSAIYETPAARLKAEIRREERKQAIKELAKIL